MLPRSSIPGRARAVRRRQPGEALRPAARLWLVSMAPKAKLPAGDDDRGAESSAATGCRGRPLQRFRRCSSNGTRAGIATGRRPDRRSRSARRDEPRSQRTGRQPSPVTRPGLRAVAQGRKGLSLGVIFCVGRSQRILGRCQLRELSRSLPRQLLMCQPLVTVTLGGGVGGTVAAVVGRLARPVEPRDRLAILPRGHRHGSEQLRLGSVQQPCQHQTMERKRTHPQPALPARGRGIQLGKHL